MRAGGLAWLWVANGGFRFTVDFYGFGFLMVVGSDGGGFSLRVVMGIDMWWVYCRLFGFCGQWLWVLIWVWICYGLFGYYGQWWFSVVVGFDMGLDFLFG